MKKLHTNTLIPILSTNQPAPTFSAFDQHGVLHRLEDYRGLWLVLYFYPKDDTPGCTREACGIRDNLSELSALATVCGVSADSVASHKKFADKYSLPFTLLSDPEKKMLSTYQADGRLFAKRTTFLIDPSGMIAKIYEKVSPDTHAQALLDDLKKFQAG